MTLTSRLHDFAGAVATAINARSGLVGASAYDLYVINGGTLTQTQWLQANAPRFLTKVQREALTGADLFPGRTLFDTTAQREYFYGPANSKWYTRQAQVSLVMNGGASVNCVVGGVSLFPINAVASSTPDCPFGWNLAAANDQVTIRENGLYHVIGRLTVDHAAATTYRAAILRRNGAALVEAGLRSTTGVVTANYLAELAAGDIISLGYYVDGAADMAPGVNYNSLTVARLG